VIRLLGQVSQLTAVAVSGGVDSMAALSFLSRNRKPSAIKAVYFHHGTAHGEEALKFLANYCGDNHTPLLIGRITAPKGKGQSWEEYWRNQRYSYFSSLPLERIVTAHQLNDVAETYVMGFIRGQTRLIPYCREPNIYRPFLLNSRQELLSWCERHHVPWIDDPSNTDVSYDRNRVRHQILPEMLAMNPGFLRQVARKVATQSQIIHPCSVKPCSDNFDTTESVLAESPERLSAEHSDF